MIVCMEMLAGLKLQFVVLCCVVDAKAYNTFTMEFGVAHKHVQMMTFVFPNDGFPPLLPLCGIHFYHATRLHILFDHQIKSHITTKSDTPYLGFSMEMLFHHVFFRWCQPPIILTSRTWLLYTLLHLKK